MLGVLVQGARATGEKFRDNWLTPRHILDAVDHFYGGPENWFDPCPSEPLFDGLSVCWGPRVYVNPPFSQYAIWAEAAFSRFPAPEELIFISHHSHDTRWFRALLSKASAICLLKDRVKFLDPDTKEPRTTAIGKCQSLIYIGPKNQEFICDFAHLGLVLRV